MPYELTRVRMLLDSHVSKVTKVRRHQIALGSDFDGATTMPFDVTGVPLITYSLKNAGLSEHDIRLIMGENVLRVLSQSLPD